MSPKDVAFSHHTHSTLEVNPAYISDAYKEVVPIPDGLQVNNYGAWGPNDQQTPWPGGGGGGPAIEPTIMGLKRRTFFIIAWILSLVIAIGVGVGGSLGATMGSRNNNTCAAADGGVAETQITQSGTTISSSATIQTPGGNNNNNNGVLTTSQSSAYTSVPPRSSTILSDPSPSTSQPRSSSTSDPSILGGRCANGWGSDCICLDESTCRNKWKGTPYTGYSPNWPCPNEPDNVMACVVKPCLGQVAPAQCLWKEACSSFNITTDAKLICPGGSDFICCGHSW